MIEPHTSSAAETFAAFLSQLWPERAAADPRPRHTLPIVSLAPQGPRYWSLVVEAPCAFGAPSPGQYTTLGLGDLEPRYLVIARADANEWEFLIDRDSTLGRTLEGYDTTQGALVSGPEGPGWDIDELLAPERLLAFATGSGVATVMPALRHILASAPDRLARVSLYYGESRPEDFAYGEELAALEARGLEVRRVWSERQDGEPRFVQQQLERDGWAPSDCAVMLAGAPVMIRHVTLHLLTRGGAQEHIHTNMRD